VLQQWEEKETGQSHYSTHFELSARPGDPAAGLTAVNCRQCSGASSSSSIFSASRYLISRVRAGFIPPWGTSTTASSLIRSPEPPENLQARRATIALRSRSYRHRSAPPWNKRKLTAVNAIFNVHLNTIHRTAFPLETQEPLTPKNVDHITICYFCLDRGRLFSIQSRHSAIKGDYCVIVRIHRDNGLKATFTKCDTNR
jgi:hypothetical protein